jgi:hypothetical protein
MASQVSEIGLGTVVAVIEAQAKRGRGRARGTRRFE